MYPIHLGTPEDFTVVRELLARADFNEPAIARRLNVPQLTQQTIDRSAEPAESSVDLLALLIRVFVCNGFVPVQSLTAVLSQGERDALSRLGLLLSQDERFYSPVCLCPVSGVHTVSDRWKGPDGKKLEGMDDIVYPSVVPNTRLFLDLLPESRCESLLDLCSGTGVAALIAAKNYAAEAHAYDIAPRSTHFAEFAKRLNGISNLTTGTGDLYEPAAGRTFDRIVAHPPYVPVLESKWIFYSGGEDGEHVTRRMIEELPRYLRPGGTLYCLAMASDRVNEPLEQRIRTWLGKGAKEFDVAVVVRRVVEPQEFAFDSLVRSEHVEGQAQRWKELFEKARVTGLPYAMMMVQRKAAGREPFTVRRQTGSQTGRAEHQWLLEWETQAASDPNSVLDLRLRASSQSLLQVVNRLKEGDWEPAGYTLATNHPFRAEMQVDPWIALFLARCDGSKSAGELFEELKAEEIIHSTTEPQQFAQVVTTLISGGFLAAGLSRSRAAE